MELKNSAVIEHPEQKGGVNPSELKKWIRDIEIPFYDVLTKYGDLEGLGRKPQEGKFTNFDSGKFVGTELCAVATRAFWEGIRKKFGSNVDVARWIGPVEFTNHLIAKADGSNTKDAIDIHIWIRIKGTNGKYYFIDPTYGQINHRLNRIVFDEVENEHLYYHFPKDWKRDPSVPIPLEVYYHSPEPSDEGWISGLIGEEIFDDNKEERVKLYKDLVSAIV